jgi:hypothetical protein
MTTTAIATRVTDSVDTTTGEVMPAPTFSMGDYIDAVASDIALRQSRQFANAYNSVCAALIGDDDVQAAERGKVFKKKSAWRKLARHFRISTAIVHVEKEWLEDGEGRAYYYAEVHVCATAPWGQSMTALGACSTQESRFSGRAAMQKAANDVLATAETRATNRAVSNLIAAGEVSAEEVDGNGRTERMEGATPEQIAALMFAAHELDAATAQGVAALIAEGLTAERAARALAKLEARMGRKTDADTGEVVDAETEPF